MLKFKCAQISLMPDRAIVIGSLTSDDLPNDVYSINFPLTTDKAMSEFKAGESYSVEFKLETKPETTETTASA